MASKASKDKQSSAADGSNKKTEITRLFSNKKQLMLT